MYRAILKWAPVCAGLLLLLVWAGTSRVDANLAVRYGGRELRGWVLFGDGMLSWKKSPKTGFDFVWHVTNERYSIVTLLGRFGYRGPSGGPLPTYWEIRCPLLCIATAMLPLAVGASTRFRFSLWQWLAFMTLVSAECAYYLGHR